MAKILLIAGHGEKANGGFDPGATGYITKGEHRYYEQDFFKAMRKFLPEVHNLVLFSDYNVYDYGNLVSLARKYGDDTVVVEMHFDALDAPNARGGHVIVYGGYEPDKIDLAIRDVIKKHVGVRYSHRGQEGISGRTDLYNTNLAAQNGINYRLIELGFCTNQDDANIMINNVEAIAKDFVKALVGKVKPADPVTVVDSVKVAKQPAQNKSIDELAKEVIAGMHGAGDDRKKALGSNYAAVQAKVNAILSGAKATGKRSIEQVAKDVLAGKYGNGEARKRNIEADGYNYAAVQSKVNEVLGHGISIDVLAHEVLAGQWGNGADRRNRLLGAGYDYNAVQAYVNKLI